MFLLENKLKKLLSNKNNFEFGIKCQTLQSSIDLVEWLIRNDFHFQKGAHLINEGVYNLCIKDKHRFFSYTYNPTLSILFRYSDLFLQEMVGRAMAIHCASKMQYLHLLNCLHSMGFVWSSNNSLMDQEVANMNYRHGKRTCLVMHENKNIAFGTVEFYIEKGYEIIEFNYLFKIEQESSPNEIMSITPEELAEKQIYYLEDLVLSRLNEISSLIKEDKLDDIDLNFKWGNTNLDISEVLKKIKQLKELVNKITK